MFIGRLLAYIFLCMMLMVIGAEVLRLLEGGEGGWITVSQVMDFFSSTGDGQAEPDISETEMGSMWANLFEPILNFSAFFAFMILSGILFFMSRKRFR